MPIPPQGFRNLNEISGFLRLIEKKFNTLEAHISSVMLQGEGPASLPGQYTGKPIPTTEGVEIDIEANVNQVSGNIVLAADGPFIAHKILFAWRPVEQPGGQLWATENQWRPISSVSGRETRAANTIDTLDAIDFYWAYTVTGSRRERQNVPVPSACLETETESGAGVYHLACPDAFSKSSTITVRVTPINAPVSTGVIWVGFHGYYILD